MYWHYMRQTCLWIPLLLLFGHEFWPARGTSPPRTPAGDLSSFGDHVVYQIVPSVPLWVHPIFWPMRFSHTFPAWNGFLGKWQRCLDNKSFRFLDRMVMRSWYSMIWHPREITFLQWMVPASTTWCSHVWWSWRFLPWYPHEIVSRNPMISPFNHHFPIQSALPRSFLHQC